MNKENRVSPSTPSRRRLASAVVAAVMGVLVLAGCGTGQGSAGNYSELEDAFLEGCEATMAEDAGAEGARDLPDDFCQCSFDALSDEDDGVKFDTLMDINGDLTEDPAALPDEVTEVFADCAPPS